jgi:hypothetical protein
MAQFKAPAGGHYQYGLYGSERCMGGLGYGLPIHLVSLVEGGNFNKYIDFSDGFAFGAAAATNSPIGWTWNTIGAGTGAAPVLGAAYLQMDSGTADDSGLQIELGVPSATVPSAPLPLLVDNSFIIYAAKFQKDIPAAGHIWMGFSNSLGGTDLIGVGGVLTAVTDGIGFTTTGPSPNLILQAKRASGAKSGNSGVITTMLANTDVEVGFRVDVGDISDNTNNGSIQGYIKSGGVWKKAGTPIIGCVSEIVTMNLSMAISNFTATDTDMFVDYVFCHVGQPR